MRIAIVNSKGGVGKTTSAVYLATAAARDGQTVELWDADVQGSAYEWALQAEEEGRPLEFPVLPATLPRLRRGAPAGEWVIIDTPPGHQELMQAAVETADLVLVPIDPSVMGWQRAQATLDGVAHGKPAAVLVCMTDSRESLTRATTEMLKEEDAPPAFNRTIPRRSIIAQSSYSRPGKLHGYDSIYKEIKEIADEQ